MNDDSNLAYMLVIQPRKQALADKITSSGLIRYPAVGKMDFIHGSFDFIITLQRSHPGR